MIDFNPDTMTHQPPMRLVDRLLDVGENDGATAFTLGPENLFLDETGHLLRETLVEVMAQAFMAVSVYKARQSGAPTPGGYIAGLRSIRFYEDASLGDTLVTKVRVTDQIAQITMVAGQVFRDQTLLAEGELRLYTLPSA
jgi:predicted hotdog family 3-hydroxylacyl-ACP dehydratase